MDKLMGLKEAVALIKDGDQVIVGGHPVNKAPMAIAHEMIRQGKKSLDLVFSSNGFVIDLLVGAGCARSLRGAFVSFDVPKYGMAMNFRRAVESGEVVFHEYS